MVRATSTKFKPEWVLVDGLTLSYTLKGFPGCGYWKGQKGWWASRPGEPLLGPFSREGQARKCAEEPAEKRHAEGILKAKDRMAMKAAVKEEVQVGIWGSLAPKDRQLRPGQVWAMKAQGRRIHQVLILDVRKDSVLALVRSDGTRWQRCMKDVRSTHALLRLYCYQGEARVPKRT